jgi:hypothetical protein
MNQRGLAMPAALVALSILLALVLALSMLGGTEPVIARNHALSARARALAESGVERALWALSHPQAAGGIAEPMPSSPAPAPYDGAAASFRTMEVSGISQGGFVVAVTTAASGRADERDIAAVGYVADATSPLATKRIVTTATRLKRLDPPCALCLGGEAPADSTPTLHLGATASVHGSNVAADPAAVYCAGQAPSSAILTTGLVVPSGAADVVAPPGGTAVSADASATSFAPFTLADADIAVLKVLARANGTYYQGAHVFATPPPDGIVFVDTPSGQPLSPSSPSSDLVEVDVRGTWATGWRGWFIVAGSLRVTGQVDLTGLVYAQDAVRYEGDGRIRGAIVAGHRIGTGASHIASEGGRSLVAYDCPAVRSGGGTLAQGWFVKPGSYREVSEL